MKFAWRIVDSRFVAAAFTGEGARLYGGRWNRPGAPIVYLSEHLSLAVLEQVVHLEQYASRVEFSIFRVVIPPKVKIVTVTTLPAGWRDEPASDASKDIGDTWINDAKGAVLRVPSVIVPTEYNYLLNPSHPDFSRLRIGPAEPFQLDGRLWGRAS